MSYPYPQNGFWANPVSYVSSPMERLYEAEQEIARLRMENDKLRRELTERTEPTSPIRLLNDLRAGLDQTRARLRETERWR